MSEISQAVEALLYDPHFLYRENLYPDELAVIKKTAYGMWTDQCRLCLGVRRQHAKDCLGPKILEAIGVTPTAPERSK